MAVAVAAMSVVVVHVVRVVVGVPVGGGVAVPAVHGAFRAAEEAAGLRGAAKRKVMSLKWCVFMTEFMTRRFTAMGT